MKEIFKLKTFWIIFAAAALVFFVALINFNRVWESEAQVLIIPKSETAAENSEQMVENFKVLVASLSFYEKIAKDDEDLLDKTVSELPAGKKKIYWNSKIKTERLEKSGVIRIKTLDKSRFQSEALNNQAVKTLIAAAGFYYNIKTDIDIRVIESSVSKEIVSHSKIALFLESLAGTFILTVISFLISFSLFKNGKKEKISPRVQEKKTWVASSVPENLPIKEPEKQLAVEEPIIREATPEEVKERLNKLLSGKL